MASIAIPPRSCANFETGRDCDATSEKGRFANGLSPIRGPARYCPAVEVTVWLAWLPCGTAATQVGKPDTE
jgi:hypothetical protein